MKGIKQIECTNNVSQDKNNHMLFNRKISVLFPYDNLEEYPAADISLLMPGLQVNRNAMLIITLLKYSFMQLVYILTVTVLKTSRSSTCYSMWLSSLK